jgi:hypothetical protein
MKTKPGVWFATHEQVAQAAAEKLGRCRVRPRGTGPEGPAYEEPNPPGLKARPTTIT